MTDPQAPTVLEVAEWLKREVLEGETYLSQGAAVAGISQRFGARFIHQIKGGGLGVSTRVLREFVKISKDSVVWSRKYRYWRPRQSDDPKGRQVEY